MTYRRWVGRVLQALIILVILGFWGRALWRDWRQVVTYGWRIAWPWLALSFAVLTGQVILLASAWWRTLFLMGAPISWRRGLALWFQSQLARYVPGGVWDVAARLALGQQIGISKRSMSASVGLEMGVQVSSALPFVAAAFLLEGEGGWELRLPLGLLLALGGVLLLGVLICLAPPVFSRVVNWGLRLLHRPPLTLQLTYGDMLILFLARVLGHGLMGLGLVLFAQGVAPISWQLAPLLSASYIAAWLVGYLAIPIPTGLGVREGVFLLLLSGHVPFAAISGIALGYRVWIALRDLLVAASGFGLSRSTLTTDPALTPPEAARRARASD